MIGRQPSDDERAVADLEAAVIHLTRAMLRLSYLDDYLSHRGQRAAGRLWDQVAEAQAAIAGLLEDETIDDARRAGKRLIRRRVAGAHLRRPKGNCE